jgi:hypothetical protein
MIKMSVGTKQADGLQTSVGQILQDGLALRIVEGSTIDDDTLASFVADDIGVLLKRIELKNFDI